MIDQGGAFATMDKRDEKKYSRLLLNKVFRAKITAIDTTKDPRWIQVQRNGEDSPDPNWYVAAAPGGYTPQVGDEIDLIWRDDVTAHILAVLRPAEGSSLKGMQLFAYGTAVVGSVPDNPRFMEQAGYILGTPSGAGDILLSWTAFPNGGVLELNVTPGDIVAGITSFVAHDYTGTTAALRCFNGTTPITSGIIPVHYRVIGW